MYYLGGSSRMRPLGALQLEYYRVVDGEGSGVGKAVNHTAVFEYKADRQCRRCVHDSAGALRAGVLWRNYNLH